jgi:hypothetical protein
LVQAKKKRSDSASWGKLTPNQQDVLPARLDYASLLLYRLTDFEQRSLGPFEWCRCRGHSIGEVVTWLKTDSFPESLTSAVILGQLARKEIGTTEEQAVNQIIAPQGARLLAVSIDWDGGTPPSPPTPPTGGNFSVKPTVHSPRRRTS